MQQWYTFFSLKMLFYGTSQFPTLWTHSTFANYVSPLKRQFTLQTTTAILFLCTSHLCPHIRWLISFCTTFTSSRVWLPNHYVVISWNVKPKRVNAKSSVTWHWAAAVLPHFCKTYDLQRAWFWSHLGHASNLDFFSNHAGIRFQHSVHKSDLFAKGIRATEWPLVKGEKL